MRKAILIVAGILIALLAQGQQASFTKFKTVNDSIIARYNRGDYKGIYAMAGPTYKKQIKENSLVWDLGEDKKFTGNIMSSALTLELGKIVHIKWNGERAALNLELWMDDTSIVRFKFNDFVEQPGWVKRSISTDNLLKSKLDSIVQHNAAIYMSSPKAVGLSIGIYYRGKTYSYNYGEVEKGSGKMPNTKTIYTLGSVTKTFIGTLMAKAVTEHKLNLQDDIRKYLTGDFPNLQYQGHPVRLINLVTHTWGFSRFRINVFPPDYETMTPAEQDRYYAAYTIDSLYRDLHQVKLDTIPGIRYHYNIGGMLLAGLALEKVYQQSLDEIVRNYFGTKLHMKDTKLIADPQDLQRFAKGYNDKGELMFPMAGMTPSLYTMKTTTADMLEYLKVNVDEKLPEIKIAHQPAWGDPLSSALGLFWQVTDDFGQGRWIKHTGYDYGSITMCSLHPEEKLGMIIWANDDSRQNNLFDLERGIRESIQFLQEKKR